MAKKSPTIAMATMIPWKCHNGTRIVMKTKTAMVITFWMENVNYAIGSSSLLGIISSPNRHGRGCKPNSFKLQRKMKLETEKRLCSSSVMASKIFWVTRMEMMDRAVSYYRRTRLLCERFSTTRVIFVGNAIRQCIGQRVDEI